MIFNPNLIAFASGAIGLSALLASPAHASGATAFAYSPLFCQTVGGAFGIFPSGQIGNRSGTEKMRVFCPLIHEAKFDQTLKNTDPCGPCESGLKGSLPSILRTPRWPQPRGDGLGWTERLGRSTRYHNSEQSQLSRRE